MDTYAIPHVQDVTVAVVDDDPLVRQAIEELLESVDLRTQTYASPDEFLEAFSPDRVSCLVTDVRLPRISGPDLYRRLKQQAPDLPVIFLSGYADVETATACMQMGALDFIEKPFRAQRLLDQVQKGIERHAVSRKRARFRADFDAKAARLTHRERTVAELVVEGLRNRDIAGRLGISLKTAEGHRANMMAKMEATSTAQLVRYLLEAACAFPDRTSRSVPWEGPDNGSPITQTTRHNDFTGRCTEAPTETVGAA